MNWEQTHNEIFYVTVDPAEVSPNEYDETYDEDIGAM